MLVGDKKKEDPSKKQIPTAEELRKEEEAYYREHDRKNLFDLEEQRAKEEEDRINAIFKAGGMKP